ncbi:MAG: hydrolase [archaeon]
MEEGEEECCPEFNPEKWDNKKITWRGKLFIKDKVFSFFHIPLNFKSVMTQNIERLKEAGAYDENMIVLSDEKSLFYSNVYLSAKKPIKKALDVKVSGTFLTKVFEGPYKNMKQWIKEMKEYVETQNKEIKNLYFYHTTCPSCAKKYGKNYVVIFAEI